MGGIRAAGRDNLGRPRRVRSRAVTGIDQEIKLNKALWLLGEDMAKLERGALMRPVSAAFALNVLFNCGPD